MMQSALAIVPTEESDVKLDSSIIEHAKKLAIEIVNPETRESAYQLAKDIRTNREVVIQHYAPMKAKSDEAHKLICRQEKEDLRPYDEAINILRKSITDYDNKELLKKQIEKEKILAQQKKEAEKARCAVANEAKKSGDIAKAEAIMAQPIVVAPIETAPKLKGTSTEWVVEFFDKKAFILQLAQTPEPFLSQMLSMIEIPDSKLKKFANDIKQNKPFAGIFAKEVQKVSFR